MFDIIERRLASPKAGRNFLWGYNHWFYWAFQSFIDAIVQNEARKAQADTWKIRGLCSAVVPAEASS